MNFQIQKHADLCRFSYERCYKNKDGLKNPCSVMLRNVLIEGRESLCVNIRYSMKVSWAKGFFGNFLHYRSDTNVEEKSYIVVELIDCTIILFYFQNMILGEGIMIIVSILKKSSLSFSRSAMYSLCYLMYCV